MKKKNVKSPRKFKNNEIVWDKEYKRYSTILRRTKAGSELTCEEYELTNQPKLNSFAPFLVGGDNNYVQYDYLLAKIDNAFITRLEEEAATKLEIAKLLREWVK